MIRETLQDVRRRRRDGILFLIVAVHGVLAALIVPLQWGGLALLEASWFDKEGFGDYARILLELLFVGITHGIALAPLWLVAMGSVLIRMQWAFRLFAAAGLWGGLLVCWTFFSIASNPSADAFRYTFAPLSEVSPIAAIVISFGYMFVVAIGGWLARRIGDISLVIGDEEQPIIADRWQIGIGDLLIATALIAITLTIAQWTGEFWLDAIDRALWCEAAFLIAMVHAVVATPLIAFTAYRVATSAPPLRPRWRLVGFILFGLLEAFFIVAVKCAWLNGFSIDDNASLGGVAALVLAMTGTQLIVTVVTVRALRAAGLRVVRATSRASARS